MSDTSDITLDLCFCTWDLSPVEGLTEGGCEALVCTDQDSATGLNITAALGLFTYVSRQL